MLPYTVIKNLDEAEQVSPAIKIFHAGTTFDTDGNFVAAGGRVLDCLGLLLRAGTLRKQGPKRMMRSTLLTGQKDSTDMTLVRGH